MADIGGEAGVALDLGVEPLHHLVEGEPAERQAADQGREGGGEQSQPDGAQGAAELVEGEHLEVAVPGPERDAHRQLQPGAGPVRDVALGPPGQDGVAYPAGDQLLVHPGVPRVPAAVAVQERG